MRYAGIVDEDVESAEPLGGAADEILDRVLVGQLRGDDLGKAPDIGAYEHGDKVYWIPGFQFPHASTPIPPDGATTVKPDADLMFLAGHQGTKHIIYFGTSPTRLAKQAVLTDTNIYRPGRLEAGQAYHWRVDAVTAAGTVVEGPRWRFTVR